jgi:hypothetical protein
VFWLDVDRLQNAGLPGLEVFQGTAAQPTRLELRPCPAPEASAPAENVTPATNSP